VGLTTQGEKVLAHANRIFQEVETLEKSLGDISHQVGGPLPFGTGDLVASQLMSPLLERLLKAHPTLYPVVQTGTAHALASLVVERKLEFALLFHVPEELRETVEVSRFMQVPFDLVVAKDKLRDKRVLESFIGSREVDAQSVRRFPTLEKWRRRQPGASIKVSTNCLHAHLAMARAGVGVAVLPRFAVSEDLKRGKLVSLLKDEDLLFDLKLLARRSAPLSLNAQTLLAGLTAEAP